MKILRAVPVVAVMMAACGDPTAPSVASVSMSSSAIALQVGATRQLTATPKDAGGNSLTRAVQWTTSAANIAAVSSVGLVTANAVGTAIVSASAGDGKVGTATVTVTDTVPFAITLSVATASLPSGSTAQLATTVTNKTGGTVTASTTYISSAPTIVSVTATGLLTAVGPVGTALITATTGTVTSAPLTITVIAGSATTLTLTTAPSTSGPARATLATQPVVQVQDASGNAVAKGGVVVTAAIQSGGGTLGGSATATTIADGSATFGNLSIGGMIGTRTLTFSSPGLSSATASVSITAGLPTTMTANAGNNQFAYAGSLVSVPPAVKIVDADGNAVGGVSVQFSANAGGVVTGATQTTSASGIAAVGGWTLGAVGTNILTAHSGQVASDVAFTATAKEPPTTCGQPASLTLGVSRDGNLKASQCVITSSTRLGIGSFTGPQSGGTYFYDLYTVDVPANTIVRITVVEGGLSFEQTLLSYSTAGTFLDRSFLAPLVINNSSAATKRYQVLFTTFDAGATGTYFITAAVLVGP